MRDCSMGGCFLSWGRVGLRGQPTLVVPARGLVEEVEVMGVDDTVLIELSARMLL